MVHEKRNKGPIEPGALKLATPWEPGSPERYQEDCEFLRVEFDALEEEDQCKHVYSCFGLAAYWAQCFEVELRHLLLLRGIVSGESRTREQRDVLETNLEKQTLGTLIRAIRCYVEVTDNAQGLLEKALDRRNFLSHHFFFERSFQWCSINGRRALTAELVSYVDLFRTGDEMARTVTAELLKAGGVTEEILRKAYIELRAEAAKL